MVYLKHCPLVFLFEKSLNNNKNISSQLVLSEAVPAGAIETLFDRENKPWFKRADLGRCLGIVDIV